MKFCLEENQKKITIKKVHKLHSSVKKNFIRFKTNFKKKIFKGLKFSNLPILMGVLNLTPDSFSDGGQYIKKNLGEIHAKKLINDGCGILDIGGEATNPGSEEVKK